MLRPTSTSVAPGVIIALALATSASAGNWPAWRGPAGTGVSNETGLPIHWSATENVTWKTPLPDGGNSTPVVWGDRVFITQATEKGARRSLLCFDRATGEQKWARTVDHTGGEPTHKTNPYAASSPVTDGERVVVWHGSAGMFAYDFEGRELWQRDLGTFTHIWGYASSPVIHEDKVLALCGPGLRVLLVALDKRTGDPVWQRDLPEATAKKAKDFFGAWGTPVLRRANDRVELVVALPKQLAGFDPETGERLWFAEGLTDLVYTTPLPGPDDIVVAMSGYHGAAMAVRARGNGDLTDQVLWRERKNPQRVGSGVIAGDHIYILNDPGAAHCIDLRTGEIVWKERLGGKSWSSMVLAEGRLYVVDMRGETFVLKASPQFEVVARNPLGELTRGSIAVSDGQLFIRTYEHLYCIGPRKKTP